MRIGGVSVGKVKAIEPAPPDVRLQGRDVAAVEIEIEPQYAPISKDAEAILRQKTLLGETFIELTSGTEPGDGADPELAQVALGDSVELPEGAVPAEALPEGGTLGVGQTREATQIDEIFNALDDETREAFQRWQAERVGRDPRPRPRLQRRAREPGAVHHRRLGHARDPRRPGGRPCARSCATSASPSRRSASGARS